MGKDGVVIEKIDIYSLRIYSISQYYSISLKTVIYYSFKYYKDDITLSCSQALLISAYVTCLFWDRDILEWVSVWRINAKLILIPEHMLLSA